MSNVAAIARSAVITNNALYQTQVSSVKTLSILEWPYILFFSEDKKIWRNAWGTVELT